MQSMIDKIYNLVHKPIVTPHNLLENSKLNNYNYVKYYKNHNGLVCEMEFKIEYTDNKCEKFYYFFDAKDYLQKIERDLGDGEREIVFEREIEVKKNKREFLNRPTVDENMA